MSIKLPRKCFISHSYKDAAQRKLLYDTLPSNVEPFMFPPITVAPDEMVSNELIDAILKHEGLIYLEGGYSAQSFWVAFERDYALRAKKKVYAFNPETRAIQTHTGKPLKLPVLATYSRNDKEQVLALTGFMAKERYFNVWIFNDPPSSRDVLAGKEVRMRLVEHMNKGGFGLFFWSKNAAQSKRVFKDLRFALDYNRYFPDGGRVLLALLDDTPLPDWIMEVVQSNFVIKPVQLFGDKELSEVHRLDNLIVSLYWLIHRNTQSRLLE